LKRNCVLTYYSAYSKQPVILSIWGISCLALPWVLFLIAAGGTLLTVGTIAALYKLDFLPQELLAEIGLAGNLVGVCPVVDVDGCV